MTVYVDDFHKWSMSHFQNMKMSHMVADSLEELHSMADAIGVRRKHFQNTTSGPHYDIAKSKRKLALQNGAVAITVRECARMTAVRRVTGKLPRPNKAERAWKRMQSKLRKQLEEHHARRDFIRERQREAQKPKKKKIVRLRLNAGDDNANTKTRNVARVRLGKDRKTIERANLGLPKAKLAAVKRPKKSTKQRPRGFF